jgi:hypothetical protein
VAVIAEPSAVLGVLRLPAATAVEVEPLGGLPGSPERWHISAPGGSRTVIVRCPRDPEEGANHAAMMEALASAKFPHVPELLGFAGEATVESEPNGVTALQLVPPPGAAEAAIEALAAFHALPIREGLDWGCTPGDLYPPDEVPLHRLGFTADERERAREPLLRAREALWASPFGLAHRDATSGNILLANGRAWLTDFGRAGYGPQLFDVAAFLLTSGIEGAGRRALAAAYARARGWEAPVTVDLVDLLGILWGIEELLVLPRKLIETLGDDAATAHLKLSASRIDKGIRQTAGSSAVAAAIRAALWPA